MIEKRREGMTMALTEAEAEAVAVAEAEAEAAKRRKIKSSSDFLSWLLFSVPVRAQQHYIINKRSHLLTAHIVDLFKHRHQAYNSEKQKGNAIAITHNQEWKVILSAFVGGHRIAVGNDYNKTKHHQSSYLRALPYVVHNIIKALFLALPLTIEVLLKRATLHLWHNELTGKVKHLLQAAALLVGTVCLVTRIVNTALSLILEPIAICQRAWKVSPVLGVISALLSTAAYAAAPILLCKYAPVVFSKVIAKISAVPLLHHLTTAKTLIQCTATAAICAVPFLLRGLVSIFKWGRKKSSAQSRTRTGSMSPEDTSISETSSIPSLDLDLLDNESLISDSDSVADGKPKEQQPGGLSSSS